ncbi:MAG: hypothetical protein B7Y26_06275 [Hydrogenophilales bacterium 16-64-46]|nr:MAG: hypothetical protein B7Z32_00345 [Hydrogenophilales bacterium 12-64-13]OYZ05926.1 MAG: hypothetical protein B7Y26_06275 [Hydrogenophilales bacterium 16-64-46]OZA39862.1 MAG: hypothetical protein B7X87_02300 [Hydrogenophilales bacterium 17-64-34]HQT00283.1 glycosyltransferase [Thiobacillus sp.]
MRIAQVVASHGDGGLEKHVRELSRLLLDAGHHVVLVADPRFLADAPAGVEPVAMDFSRNRRNPFLLWAVYRALRDSRCDVIHAQANKAVAIVGALTHWLPAPTVGTLHNAKRDLAGYARLAHMITVSARLARDFPPGRASVVYNGLAAVAPQRRDLRAEFGFDTAPVLCAGGRLVEAKGFDLLLDAIDGLAINLLIVGEGPQRDALELRIARLSPPARVVLAGHRDDLQALLAAADAVVVASRREGFSYVFAEALLGGAPILSTDVPVANEILPPALIVPADAAALRGRLTALLADRAGWDAAMAEPRRFGATKLTLEAMRDGTIAVYRSLIGRN